MRTPLKILILSTIALSLGSALYPPLHSWLALSWWGIKHFYFWQFLTYVFVEPGPLSFGSLLQLAFNMYVLWIFGSSLLERAHATHFFALYFGATLLSGFALFLFPYGILAGSSTAVYAILVAWMMRNQGSRLLLFFALPFKAHWLIVGLISFSLFIDITSSAWLSALTLCISSLFGYLFALLVWREMSPFEILRPFERKILKLLEKKAKPYVSSKVFDIKSGEPILSDEQFMDAMLDRISRYGENSLTAEEKNRMRKISAKKK